MLLKSNAELFSILSLSTSYEEPRVKLSSNSAWPK